jgi:hypothetical protein
MLSCNSENESGDAAPSATQATRTAPLSADDPDGGARPGSPEAAIQRALFWARWGNWPSLVAAYHPRVREAIEPSGIANTYSAQRESLRQIRVRPVASRETANGLFVAVAMRGPDSVSYESYLLGREDGQWRILYDTYFDGAYGAFVQNQADLSSNNAGDAPSDEAVKAGQDAAAFYRGLFLPAGP